MTIFINPLFGSRRGIVSLYRAVGWSLIGGRTFSLLYDTPARIGIKLAHCGCCFCSGLSQILLKQHAILIDHETHYARVAVLGRIGDEGKATRHLPIDHVVLRPARRFIALALQHTKVIAVECGVSLWRCTVPFSRCERRQWPERARGLAL